MNYYDLLEVKENATTSEIKKSYKSLVKKYHPDVFLGDKSFAESKIKELNEAYEVLSNKISRQEYDKILNSTDKINQSETFEDDFLSHKQDLDKKYNEMYNYDYYKKYTTNYYGVDKSNKKYENNYTTNNIQSKLKFTLNKTFQNIQIKTLLLIILLIIIIGIIITFTLIFKIKKIVSSSSYNENTHSLESNYMFNTYLDNYNFNGVITLGLSGLVIENFYGEADKYEEKSNSIYAYYKTSYIIYNKLGIVIGFENNGYFLTEEVLNKFQK